tara:strand:- start:4275 stop:5420 length:1146 start_codon:yes stop_codon:yes gene_type:complete
MKITIKRTDDQVALVQAMGSNNREEAYEAQAAVAELIGPVVDEVINNAPTVSNLFTTLTYQWDDNPSLPLDLFHDITDEDYIQVYSQTVAGGLPYNQVFPAHNELKFATYNLDSALAFDRKYVRKARLDVVSKTFTRMAQEILLKQERTSFNVIATALVLANSISSAGGTAAAGNHVIRTGATDRFVLHDLNRLITLSKRINSSWAGGTPVGGPKAGITDLMISPEMSQELRAMAYNPINTVEAPYTSALKDSLQAPDELRNTLYNAAGLPQFYGINIMELNELGKSQRFNKIFATVNSNNGSPVSSFASDDDEIMIGVDRSKDALIRPVVLDEGNTGDLSIMVDDQFSVRQNKIGYYAKVEEGRICIDDNALCGLAVELS